jgi:7-cyano-7-deazaguanine reductase
MTNNLDILETFDNPNELRDYIIKITTPEFTCLCPKTGQPDFAEIILRYIPNQYCIELKSYKLYMHSYRSLGAFHEAITNKIADDLIALLNPRKLSLEAIFNVRGGVYTSVSVNHNWDERYS